MAFMPAAVTVLQNGSAKQYTYTPVYFPSELNCFGTVSYLAVFARVEARKSPSPCKLHRRSQTVCKIHGKSLRNPEHMKIL
jgi:hypothetical protein